MARQPLAYLACALAIAHGPPPQGKACRTYSTSETRSIATPTGLISGTVKMTCEFNKATNEHVCKGDHADRGSRYSFENTYAFASLDDFIADAPRIRHFGLASTVTMKVASPGLTTSSVSTHMYDGQRRLQRIATRISSGAAAVQNFSAWDGFGRPTAATDGNQRYTYAFDDAQRIITLTNVTAGNIIRQTYDADGIHVGQTDSSPTLNQKQTFTIHKTATICK